MSKPITNARPNFEGRTCEDCGTVATIDGIVIVDEYRIPSRQAYANVRHALCLGCLADHRAAGEKVRHV